MTSNVVNNVVRILREQLQLEESRIINPEDSIVDDLGADSLDVVEIVMQIEDAFDIEIPDEEDGKCVTVQDAINLVQRYVTEPHDAGTTQYAKLESGSSFNREQDWWKIICVGPKTTLVQKEETNFYLEVETVKIEYAIEKHNESVIEQDQDD